MQKMTDAERKSRKKEYSRKHREANRDERNEDARKYRKANPEKAREHSRKHREANRDEINEKRREYREANPEKAREASRKHREANPEKARESSHKHSEANRDKLNEKQRKRREATPEKVRHFTRRWRAKKYGVEDTLTLAEYLKILIENNYCCHYGPHHTGELTQDHKVPLSKGGGHTKENVVPACRRCNCKKGTMDYEEFFEMIRLRDQ